MCSAASVLLFSFLPLLVKLALLLDFLPLSAALPPLGFPLLPLHLQSLLGLGADARGPQLLSGAALPAPGMICGLSPLDCDGRTEPQPVVVLEDEVPDLAVPGLRAKDDLARGQLPV